jgi:large subunit ribosomal protein L17
LATSLVEYGKITTTLPKAKEIVPYVEDLITKAKKGDLHNRRQIVAALSTVAAAHKLVDEIAPKLGGRNSGHLRIKHTDARVGDNAPMAIVSFVDDLTAAKEVKPATAEKPKAATKTAKAAEK